jgi:hypothetical protein
MITIKDIIENSKPHGLPGGKMTRLSNDKYILSIVGGTSGLYGDFEKDFEIGIMDTKNGEFITKLFFPENSDDVVGYLEAKKVEEIANSLFKNYSFQVR